MASEQGPRYDLIYQNNDAARNEQLRYTVTSLADKLAATTDRAKAAEADNAQQADRIAALEAEVARLTDERDELLRHQNTRECTRYGHRWRDAFGPDGALCECGGMVFAVWANESRPSTAWERANPSRVRVIENPERSARARDAEDAAEEAALTASSAGRTSGGPRADDGEG